MFRRWRIRIQRRLFRPRVGFLFACIIFLSCSFWWTRPVRRIPTNKDLKLFSNVLRLNDKPALVFPEHKVLFCPIYKNLHIPMLALMCRKASESDGTIQLDYRRLDMTGFTMTLISYCLPKLQRFNPRLHKSIWAQDPEEEGAERSGSEWKKIAILRHPFDRFLGLWSQVCSSRGSIKKIPKNLRQSDGHCYGCEDDLHCFIERQFQHFRNMTMTGIAYSEFDGDATFYPQAWHCNLYKYASQYTNLLQFRKDSLFTEELRDVFINMGWEGVINTGWGNDGGMRFLEDRDDFSSDDALVQQFQRFLMENIFHANLLFKTYYSDFLYLNFAVPESLREACENIETPSVEEEYFNDQEKHYPVCLWEPLEG